MSRLLLKAKRGTGLIASVTPESAGWTYVGMDIHRLTPGDTLAAETGSRETCVVFLTGTGTASAGGGDLGALGGRMSVFEGKPWSIYVPEQSDWSVTATSDLELAVCTAPGLGGGLPVRVIAPDDLKIETRGKTSNTRYVVNILPEGEPADSLLVVEVITPGGNTSSYPSHKHDRDNLPHESLLEETYYHRINPPQGFAFQRVYTDADENGVRSLDETMAVEDGDVVLVPEGYHPCGAAHGYDLYYLNVMAGPTRIWKFHNAPEHEWLMKGGAAPGQLFAPE